MTAQDKKEVAEIVEIAVIKAMDEYGKGLSNRLLSTFAIVVTLFLFIIGGSYAFTVRVDDRVDDMKDRCEEVSDKQLARDVDMSTIIWHIRELRPEHNENLQDMESRYLQFRGQVIE